LSSERRPVVELLERRHDRSTLAASGLRDRLRTELLCQSAAGCVAGDDQRPAGHDRRREHVAEHREREPRARLLGGVEPLLPVLAAEGDHDLRHRARL
jgi:hypothetical protein